MPLLGITMQDVKRVFVKDGFEFRNSPENPATSLSQPAKWLTSLFTGPVSSGVAVNQDTTLGITAVWRAVRIIGEGIAGLEGSVVKIDKNGNKKKLPNHRVSRQLKEPSPLYTGFTFKETLSAYAALRGNGIARIENNGTFTLIDPSDVKTVFASGKLVYVYTDLSGKEIRVDSSEIFHVPSLVMEPGAALGKSPLQVHRETMGVSIAQTRYSAKFFKNGAHVSGYLSTDTKLSKEGAERMSRSWNARFSGVDNVGKTPVLEEGLKYNPLSLNPKDAMFVESSRLSVEDISRIFGIPPHMLSSMDRATFSNIEHQSRELVTYTLRPWVSRWEEEIDRKLFTENEKSRGYRYEFDLESLLRGDSEARARLIDTKMKWGISTINEIRRKEGDNESDDPNADKHFVPVNMIPIDQAGRQSEIEFPDQVNTEEDEREPTNTV